MWKGGKGCVSSGSGCCAKALGATANARRSTTAKIVDFGGTNSLLNAEQSCALGHEQILREVLAPRATIGDERGAGAKAPHAEFARRARGRQCTDQLDRSADGLYFGVGFEGFVAHFAAPAGLFVAAEGKGGVKNIEAIDPDCAGSQL